jgi:lysophospholipase L1-like esterase
MPRILIALVLFLVASCSSGGGPTAPQVDFTNKVIVAFGNSITAGVGDTGYPSTAAGYPFRLEKLLKPLVPNVIVLNRGRPGEETNEGEMRLVSVLNRDQPDYVLILEGTNDIQDSGASEANRIVRDLEGMVREVKEFGAIPLIASLLPTKGRWAWRNEVISIINPQIQAMAVREGITFVDQHAAFVSDPDWKELLTDDDLHPNSDGYVIMAETWYEGLLVTF